MAIVDPLPDNYMGDSLPYHIVFNLSPHQVFPGQEYVSLAALSENVPILSCGGISKRYMVPGWRLGWVLIYDRNNLFKDEVIPGLSRLAMKLLGPCTLIQAALPHIFDHTPQSYYDGNMRIFQRNAELVYKGLKTAPGLSPVMPAGSMYMMVRRSQDY